MQLQGYPRENGTVGFRNHILILPTVYCATKTAKRIADQTDSAIAYNIHGCGHLGEDYEIAKRTLAGIGQNPNVAAVLVVELGCEKIDATELAHEIAKTKKPVEIVSIQKDGGTTATIEKGIEIVNGWNKKYKNTERVPVDINNVTIGVKCGASDPFSGLIANPVTGIVADKIVQQGGTILLPEVTEFIGAEHCLIERAATPEVAKQIQQIVTNYENILLDYKVDIRGTQPSPGNIKAGLTTIEEKSLGAIHKGGHHRIQEVVDYSQPPSKKGLVIMDGPAVDVVCNTGLTAAGAQLIIFTTGLGTPIGSPIAPVIKVTGTPETAKKMACNMDFAADGIIEGTETIENVGEQLYQYTLEVLNGKLCKAEQLGFDEFDFYRAAVNT
ncbi:MAG: UxaA family hydrolase [Planctomycetes bacterium]|nr:UxaA family hydrolase [Planctomycetota bacterium]